MRFGFAFLFALLSLIFIPSFIWAQAGGGPGDDQSPPEFVVLDFNDGGQLVKAYSPGLGVLENSELFDYFESQLGYTVEEMADLDQLISQAATDAAIEQLFAQLEGVDEAGFAVVSMVENSVTSAFTVDRNYFASEIAFDAETTFVEDGYSWEMAVGMMKSLLLDRKRRRGKGLMGWVKQHYIYVESSDGTTYWPTDGDSFVDVLNEIEENGETAEHIIIKGHGSSETIEIGDDGDILVISGDTITISNVDDPNDNTDISEDLGDVCDSGTRIDLRGCSTAGLAEDLDGALGGDPTVSGSRIPVIGIPWTKNTIGPYIEY